MVLRNGGRGLMVEEVLGECMETGILKDMM